VVVSKKGRKKNEKKGNKLAHSRCFGTDKYYAEIGSWCELARHLASSDTAE